MLFVAMRRRPKGFPLIDDTDGESELVCQGRSEELRASYAGRVGLGEFELIIRPQLVSLAQLPNALAE